MEISRLLLVFEIGLLVAGCQTVSRVTVQTVSCVTVVDELAIEARKLLLDPPRRDVHLNAVDVPTAVREIQRQFNWYPQFGKNLEKDFGYVKDIRVTFDRKGASLAEALVDLCNQTGFHAFEEFENIGIYGAIGYAETGGRNLAFAEDGLLALLSIMQRQNEKLQTYSIFLQISDAVPWLYHNNARLQIDELIYPDGTRVQNVEVASVSRGLLLDPLIANDGRIASISGTLTIYLPDRVASEELSLYMEAVPQEKRSEYNFVRVMELKAIEHGWLLTCEFGHCSPSYLEREGPTLDYGHVDALDSSGTLLNGQVVGAGGGSSSSGDGQSSTNEYYKILEIECPTRPTSIRWTFVTQSQEYLIPVQFIDCRFPDVLWRPKPDKDKEHVQQTEPTVSTESTMNASSYVQ